MIFAIYKPAGLGSRAVVEVVKKILGAKKAGHAGTLDPLARGVLVIATDKDTKQLKNIIGSEKSIKQLLSLGRLVRPMIEKGELNLLKLKKFPLLRK